MTLSRRDVICVTAASALSAALPSVTWAQDANALPDYPIGESGAPVEIIEYASFTCPHCASFHADQLEKLKSSYIAEGKVRFIHREAIFDRYGLWATAIARCAGEATYHPIVNQIYRRQREWAGAQNDAALVQELKKIGKMVGLGEDELNACLSNEEELKKIVLWSRGLIDEAGVTGTPTLFINGDKVSNRSFEELSELIDAKLNP